MTLALLCSGQGRQHSGMFAVTAAAPEAAPVFAHAATLLGGIDPRALVRAADAPQLHHNRIGQVLCSLQALAAAAALHAQMPRQITIAGYSVGEVAAWGVANVLDAADALDLAARRAEAMDAATVAGDGLLHVRGLPRAVVDQLCVTYGAAIAIVNPGDAFVVGGGRAALEAIAGEATQRPGARAVVIAVEVASHTPRLSRAAHAFRDALSRVPAVFPAATGIRLLSGVDGAAVLDAVTGLDKLAAQVSSTVQWAACLQACIESGATAFLELGPGSALKDMVTSAYPGVAARSIEDFRTIDGARAWVTKVGSGNGR